LERQHAEQVKREAEWIASTAPQLEAPVTEEQLSKILEGGPEAVTVLQEIRKRDMAYAMLNAQKNIAQNLNPLLAKFDAALSPLLANHEQLARYQVTQQFVHKYPDFKSHIQFATDVAQRLRETYPDQVNAMTPEQFIDEVARQTDGLLTQNYERFRQFSPNSAPTWREALKQQQTPTPTPTPTPAAAPTPTPTPAAAPTPTPAATPAPAATKPAVRPPVGSPPTVAPGTVPKDWSKSVASTLRG
jgi:hypothetical protein